MSAASGVRGERPAWLLNVSDDADNFALGVVDADSLTQRVAIGEITPGERLVDDDHVRRARSVAIA